MIYIDDDCLQFRGSLDTRKNKQDLFLLNLAGD